MADSEFPDRDPSVFLEVSRARLQSQLDACESVGGRIDSVLGWAVGVLTALFAVYALRPKSFNGWSVALICVESIAFAFVAGIALLEARGSSYSTGATVESVWGDLNSATTDREVAWNVGNNYWSAYRGNEARQNQQVRRLRIAVPALLVQTVALAAGLVIVATSA